MIAIIIVWTLFLVYAAFILFAADYADDTSPAHSKQTAEHIKSTSKLKNPGMISKG